MKSAVSAPHLQVQGGATMGENQGIEKVLEKLAQLITTKVSDASPSGNAIIAQPESIQKIELMPNEIKLEGVKNYLSWSRRALLILKTKGLESFVNGEALSHWTRNVQNGGLGALPIP